ncbi:PSD1 and planctomycete cytochrome C domain-containing protein [Prosthecobacter fusiformis]|uniref:PSD1 and planctomycete cytochrome C domain-containing protein n=1 Tax=Prosthecobacter fusiformis TaxID=48464 RepID=UPI001414DA99|nr:PSD1 and planctomycete cytochrome C domain-containing protein [Prosthecobacter fusiformis]
MFLLSLLSSPAWAVDFSKDIQPLLQRACYECHGSEVAKAGLRLHEKASALKGSDHQPVIVPGKPEESELLRRVSLPQSDKEAMPRRGTRLTKPEITALRRWIAEGARWPDTVAAVKHWAYQAPARPEVPWNAASVFPMSNATPNAIDAFVASKLVEADLNPSPPAPAHTLLRRLFFDLTGLPPNLEDQKTFLLTSEASYEEAVDHLLESPEFGVKWARHWLDLARYADSHGFQRDDLRDVWGYRDWVVDALNQDMPFDQFTLEQVAGDLLPNPTPAQIIATGFHRCTPTNVEAGTEPEESRINQVIDRVNTTAAVWLGSTLECAQCHNHKYDPFSQEDYYRLLAYFNNTEKEAERSNPKTPGSIRFDGVPYAMPEADKDSARAKLSQQLEQVKEEMARLEATETSADGHPVKMQGPLPLKPAEIQTASGAEWEVQKDQSILFIGEVPDVDSYTVDYEVSPGSLTGLMLEALTDPTLPAGGPGRAEGGRPNFVLQHLEISVVGADGSITPLKFSEAYASFSQARFDVKGLIDAVPTTGWAINPEFSKSHWAALILEHPLTLTAGMKLKLHLVQEYGGGRVIGKLRFSAFSQDVKSHLPATETLGSTRKRPAMLALDKKLKALQKNIDALKPATTEVMRELPQPRMTAIFKRGLYTDPAAPVTAGIPGIFDQKAEGPPNRLTLAKWLASKDNPLTARVAVNRIWAEIFGQGIVTTVEDFGIKGATPSHPELLDWLAIEFMEQGWSLKTLLKQIVMSQTYRQSSVIPPASPGLEADPANALLWRGPRFRLDAEAIRDNALAVSGLLSLQKGGAPIRPPQPDGLWAKVGGQQYKYLVSPGEMQYRRGLYVVLKRGAPYPSFMNFDASARMACVVKRGRSNTPLQALTLLNDPVYVEAAQALAKAMHTEPDAPSRLRAGFRRVLSREPTTEELAIMQQLYDAQIHLGEVQALVAVASALLNLDETITKG